MKDQVRRELPKEVPVEQCRNQLLVERYFQLNYELLVAQAADFVRTRAENFEQPVFGLTLGSGLNDLAKEVEVVKMIPYREIPYFPIATVAGHKGCLILGRLQGVPVICLQGRKHSYENGQVYQGLLEATFAIHLLAELKVPYYFSSNAAGGVNLNYKVGDVMVIKNHFGKYMQDPLYGRKLSFLTVQGEETPRFTPLPRPYDEKLINLLWESIQEFADHVHQGVYSAIPGPSYETPPEILVFRSQGIDATGMSVVPEVVAANNRGIKVVGISCITNATKEDGTNATDHEEVTRILESPEVKSRLAGVVRNFFGNFTKINM